MRKIRNYTYSRKYYRNIHEDYKSGTMFSYGGEFFIVFIIFIFRFLSDSTADVSFFMLAAFALLGRVQAVQALMLSWFFGMINPGLAPEGDLGAIGRYAILFTAVISVIRCKSAVVKEQERFFLILTLLLGGFLIVHSIFFSPMIDVSVLKAISWTLAMSTLLAAWLGLTDAQRDALARQLFWGLVILLVVSLPLLASPVGYLVNGTGFQGILNHPQVFGSTMALLGAWVVARMFGEPRPAWSAIALTGACVALVLMSEARTAGLAMVLGVGLAILLAPAFAGQSIVRLVPGLRSVRLWTVLIGVFLLGLIMAPTIAELVQHYITKSGRAEVGSFLEVYDRSRGRIIDPMLANIAERPFTGIGFGIASEPALMIVQRDPVFGLPVGASVEKGVTPLAVLEEVGLFGVVLVAFWLLCLLRGSARGGLVPFAVCMTALLLNMGEATLFSPGGMGLLPMIFFGWAYASGQRTGALKWVNPSGSGNASSRRIWRGWRRRSSREGGT